LTPEYYDPDIIAFTLHATRPRDNCDLNTPLFTTRFILT